MAMKKAVFALGLKKRSVITPNHASRSYFDAITH